jgi:CHAT domain-containing protein
VCLAGAVAFGAGGSPAWAQADRSPFAACRPSGPEWSYDDLLCIHRTGLQNNALPEARKRLRALGAGDDDHAWATLVLAHATLNDDEAAAIRLYEAAAQGFVRRRDAEGEVIARQNLRILYRRRGQADAAARQVALALAAAEASKQPLIVARASVLDASHLIETGGDVGRARRVLLRAERLAFPGAPIGLRRAILFNLASANSHLGMLDEAIDALERHRALRKEDGSPVDAAAVALNLLVARVSQAEARPVASRRPGLVAMARDVVADAQALARPAPEAWAHYVLADLLRPDDPAGAIGHLRRCLDLEAPLGHPELRASCLWSLSLHEAARDPARAERFSREAIALVSANPGGPRLVQAWQARMRLVWQIETEPHAIADSLEALAAIERLRKAQGDDSSRAAVFSHWTRDYYWLTGRLLDLASPRIDEAFDVGERLRARVLLDHLARAQVPGAADRVPSRARQELARHLAETQRRLASSSLAPDERRALMDRLALLELERDESASGEAPPADSVAVPFASLDAVRKALDRREAMLWYSVAPWQDLYGDFGGGAWVLAITRERVALHRLDTRVEIDSQVAALLGLLGRREASREASALAAQHLGRTLAASALAGLPPSVDRLVIVSDGALHRVPFEALQVGDRPRVLGERFEIAVVPSATLWLQLRRGGPSGTAGRTLVLADPDVPSAGPDADTRLGRLPWSRREAAAIARILRLDEDAVHQGSAASERTLKTTPLDGVLHLAAHARADTAFPERSAVFLAQGGPAEDGWLQPPEIAALRLRGALVVLSACESADGAVLAGEGPLSLARAFFAGGAGAVVATRWAMPDDDAAFVMERFYRALATGAGVGAALRQARQETIDAGRPAAAWAGIVLLGDGLRTPVGGPAQSSRAWPAVFTLSVVSVVIGWLALYARRR